ncbi:Hok/Gef family protein [Morganella morganii]
MGLIAVCITVLCFSLLMRDRLCSLNFSNGGTDMSKHTYEGVSTP